MTTPTANTKTVAVVFGGKSTEHDVSIITALASVIKPLELAGGFQVEPVYIARDGTWYWDPRLKHIELFSSGKIDEFVRTSKPASVQFDGGMTLIRHGGLAGRRQVKVDVVFPAMHGTHGEDGDLMGLLEMAGVPYVGCGVAASALSMDKVLAKLIAQANHIATPAFEYFAKSAVTTDPDAVADRCEKSLAYPLFVKPAHLGSSIGITRATNRAELMNAIEVAAHFDDKILVEEAVRNLIEVTLPIIGNDEPQPALLERPMTSSDAFFDFDTKYMHGGKKGGAKSGGKGSVSGAQGYSQLPAELPEELSEAAVRTGMSVYKALGCSGIARVDMLIDSQSGQVYFNEVNPLPGSLYAHNWRVAGVSGVELVGRLIGYAESRHADKQSITTAFATNYLKQF